MKGGSFNELELLSQEDLIVDTLRNLLRAYAEFRRREDVTRVFLESLSGFSIETRVWFILWESAGAQRFTDILRVVGCSRGKLSDVLRELIGRGLIRMVGVQYQAICPVLLVRISEPDRRKL